MSQHEFGFPSETPLDVTLAQRARDGQPGGRYGEFLELQFVDGGVRELAVQLRAHLAAGARTVRIEPPSALAELCSHIGDSGSSGVSSHGDGAQSLLRALRQNDRGPVDVTVVASEDAETVSAALLGCLDLTYGTVIAPVTAHHFSRRALFANSIPKSGSFMLAGLIRALGYDYGYDWTDAPRPQHFYYIARISHAPANSLIDLSMRNVHATSHEHPFFRTPALFIYRDPRDILISEANWFHRPENLPYAAYFTQRSFRERLLCLIDDPWLFGSIRDRVGQYAGWLDFHNVIPVSYEELVGPQGGGDAEEQLRLIWSLQLKLHVPGRPEAYAAKVYDRTSVTFNEGRIGAWREHFDAEARRRFMTLPTDFLERYGYDPEGTQFLPSRRLEYRHRRLILSSQSFADVPAIVEANIAGHNILRYRERYFAVPHGTTDINKLSEPELTALPSDSDLFLLRLRLLLPLAQPVRGPVAAMETRQAEPLGPYRNHSLMQAGDDFIGVESGLGPLDCAGDLAALVARYGDQAIIVGRTPEEVRARIDIVELQRQINSLEARLRECEKNLGT